MLRGLTTVTYLADDLAAAAKWYSGLLGIEPYFDRPEYIEFRIGDYQHELGILDRRYSRAEGAAGPRRDPAGATAYWHVDDVAATLERLVAMGAKELEAPRNFGAGFIGASVVDPFGNILGIMYNPHYLDVLGRIPAFELPEITPIVIPDSR
jgi:predicted enzyme related to lactoylglutathione lyase